MNLNPEVTLNPLRWRWLARLTCRWGVHGPEWFGHGYRRSSPRNYSVSPGHRRCTHCGAEWVAYEKDTPRPVRVIGWDRTK